MQCGLDKVPLYYIPPELGGLCKSVNVTYTERAQDQHLTHSIWHIISDTNNLFYNIIYNTISYDSSHMLMYEP